MHDMLWAKRVTRHGEISENTIHKHGKLDRQKITPLSYDNISDQGRIQGGGGPGGPGPPLSENLGIDFYSGFKFFFHVYTFIVASEKKKHKGGGAIRNPKKFRYRLL